MRNGSGWEARSAARPWCATRHDPFTRSAVAVTSPAISVVLTTYNRAALLPRAIASVLAQADAEFELIVVDDASTDRTADYLATLT
ncbi:MAG: glycosyltransferase, partial [Xanthobacteraceae bacterium]